MKFQTIKKVSLDTGIDSSSIRVMLKKGILTKYTMNGFNRVFIDIHELNSKIKSSIDKSSNIDLDRYLV